MGRLIDADELIKRVCESMEDNPHRDPKIASNHIMEHKHFIWLITNQPTACDLDNIVEKLKVTVENVVKGGSKPYDGTM